MVACGRYARGSVLSAIPTSLFERRVLTHLPRGGTDFMGPQHE